MSTDAYHYYAGELRKIVNPLDDYMRDAESLSEEPYRAGYYAELNGEYRSEGRPLVTVYKSNGHPNMPMYAVDVRGSNRRLAWYFANSFQGVLRLIKMLEPLSKNRSWVRSVH